MSAACCTLLGDGATIKQSQENRHQLSPMLYLDSSLVLEEDRKLVLESGLIQQKLQIFLIALDSLLLPGKDGLKCDLLNLSVTILHQLQKRSIDVLVLIEDSRVDELGEDVEHSLAVCKRPSGSLRSTLTIYRLRGSVFTCPCEKVWHKLTRPPLCDEGDCIENLQGTRPRVTGSCFSSSLIVVKALQHQLIRAVDSLLNLGCSFFEPVYVCTLEVRNKRATVAVGFGLRSTPSR